MKRAILQPESAQEKCSKGETMQMLECGLCWDALTRAGGNCLGGPEVDLVFCVCAHCTHTLLLGLGRGSLGMLLPCCTQDRQDLVFLHLLVILYSNILPADLVFIFLLFFLPLLNGVFKPILLFSVKGAVNPLSCLAISVCVFSHCALACQLCQSPETLASVGLQTWISLCLTTQTPLD